MKTTTRVITALGVATALAATYASPSWTQTGAASARKDDAPQVKIEVLAPESGDNAGLGGAGWFVDLALDFRGRTLSQAGFTGLQLTGPAGHNNVPPFPGTFSPGRDDRMPGLVVLTSTTTAFSGPGTNLANLFNLTGVTNRDEHGTELWDTWIVGAPIAGKDVDSVLTVAVIKDLDGNGVLDDAPNVVPDGNSDGVVDRRDLEAIGVASGVETVQFHINGNPA